MPPLRSKYKERVELALRIEQSGFEMPACSYCERNNRSCIVASNDSGRCSECVRRGARCDVEGPSSGDFQSLLREEERLSRERKETLAKLLRLDRQQEFLRTKGREMLRRGLKTMDELDEAEEKEKQEREKENAARAAETTAAPEQADPFADLGLEYPLLPPEVWAGWDFAGENPQPSQGS
jgi:hypothetical protein